MFATLQAVILGNLHILLRGDVLNADDLSDRTDAKRLRDLLHHILRGAEDQDAAWCALLDRAAYISGMSRKDENRTSYRHDAVLFLLCRCTADHFPIFDEDAVVDDGICAVFSGDP